MILSCLIFTAKAIAQSPVNEVHVSNSTTVYLTAEFHTYSCSSDCWPEDFKFLGGLYDIPDFFSYNYTFAEDGCGNNLDATDIVAVTFTEYTSSGLAASWTMSFCDLDNLDAYGAKTETYWSPYHGVFFNVRVEYISSPVVGGLNFVRIDVN